MRAIAVGMNMRMSQRGILSPDPDRDLLQRQEMRPVARPRDTYCTLTAALNMIDESVIFGCPGVSASAIILEMEVERLDRQRKKNHDFIERQRLQKFSQETQ